MKASRTTYLLSGLLCCSLASTYLIHLANQKRVVALEKQVTTYERDVVAMDAELHGLREANSALHVMLARMRANPMESSPSEPMVMVPASEEVQPTPEPEEWIEEDVGFPSEAAAPPPVYPVSIPGSPRLAPTPSPQLLQMMAQFNVDPETITNQPNEIEEYLKVNPHIREELNQPQGRYGSGIQAVMDQYPDLADKVKQAEAMADE